MKKVLSPRGPEEGLDQDPGKVSDINHYTTEASFTVVFIEQTVRRMVTTSCTGQCNLVLL